VRVALTRRAEANKLCLHKKVQKNKNN
jgi:hypothetical protein